MRNRVLALVAAAAAAVALFVVLRPDGGDEPPAAATTTQRAGSPTTTAANRRRPVTAVVVSIRVDGGLERATIPRGARVTLRVRSNVADHVHVHGYDLMRDVAPGKPAELTFRATIPGRFEVELEERGLQIAELTVRP